jgi:hypothetical protein
MTTKFRVEMLFSYGWDDAGWTKDDKPWRFDTIAEAEAEITEFINDCADAVAHGDMASGHSRDEFRIVPDTHED